MTPKKYYSHARGSAGGVLHGAVLHATAWRTAVHKNDTSAM